MCEHGEPVADIVVAVGDFCRLERPCVDHPVVLATQLLDLYVQQGKIHLSELIPFVGWLGVDAFDFMVHLQTEEMRELYQLDRLWRDAEEVSLS